MVSDEPTRAELLDAVVDSFPDIGFILRADGTYVDVLSGPGTSSLGYVSPEELVGQRLQDVLPTEEATRFQAAIDETLASGEVNRIEYVMETEDGERWFEGRIAPVRRSGTSTDHVVWVARDISRIREELQSVERTSRAIIESLNDVFFLLDRSGELIRWNSHLVETTRYTDDELAGMSATDLVTEGERTRLDEEIERVFAAGSVETELTLLTKEGQQTQYLFHVYAFDHPSRGTIGCAVGRDVSALKEYEAELETRTEQLGVLNRLMRHDIRNDLTAIIGWSEAVLEDVPPDRREDLQTVVDAAKHAVEITDIARDLADSLETSTVELEQVQLQAALESELEMCRELYPEAEVSAPETLPSVRVDADGLLSSVFRNLLNNAVQHNDADTPRVDVSVDVADSSVTVAVADNGPGIPHDRKKRIFGKSRKGLESAGTGMGLYLVDVLVDRYGGEVWVADNDPSGSVFYVELARSK